MRIVSLLPSATEIICALGLHRQLVGVTHECDYPPFVRRLPKVTRTLIPRTASSRDIDYMVRRRMQSNSALYTLDLPVLEKLRPDVIVTQALCDVCAVAEDQVRDTARRLPGHPRVINLEPQTLQEVFASIQQVAETLGLPTAGKQVVTALKGRVDAVATRAYGVSGRLKVALLEWLEPPFSSGHWNPELVRLAGGEEGLGQEGTPSRALDWHEVLDWRPEVVFIACCGFSTQRALQDLPALRSVPGWLDLPATRNSRVFVSDGSQYFSRPGPRLVDSLEILAHALHPELYSLSGDLFPAVRISDWGAPSPQRISGGRA